MLNDPMNDPTTRKIYAGMRLSPQLFTTMTRGLAVALDIDRIAAAEVDQTVAEIALRDAINWLDPELNNGAASANPRRVAQEMRVLADACDRTNSGRRAELYRLAARCVEVLGEDA